MFEPAPIYPPGAANAAARAMRAAAMTARASPTPPKRTAPAPAALAPLAVTPLQSLEVFPQTINAEYLTPMTALIEDAVSSGNADALNAYGIWINPQVGFELMRRAAAASLSGGS